MKKTMNKKKLSLAAIWAAILSVPLKVMGQETLQGYEMVYGSPNIYPRQPGLIVIKIAQRTLIAVTFIIGIINFVKIRKIGDKKQKNRKIIITIIGIIILITTILISFYLVAPALLLK